DPFPNSEVKRCCGDDSMGVALCQNSSMPGLLLHNRPLHLYGVGALVLIIPIIPRITYLAGSNFVTLSL
ncbi:hypothetical protein ACE09Y_08525, partial [Raphidiopsis sp. BLCC-F218]